MTNFTHIENELSAIGRGDARTWGRVSALLDQIDTSRYWRADSSSFTVWLSKHAKTFGVKPSMLWRHLTSGRYLNQLRLNDKFTNIPVPTLDLLPKSVGSESVEILAKLERIIPEADFESLLKRLLKGKVRRSELRTLWETHRPVLEGKNARGRNKVAPRINLTVASQVQQFNEAKLLCEFKEAGIEWTGIVKPERYDVYLNVTPDGLPSGAIKYTLPAVVMVKPKDSDVIYHAVLLGTSSQDIAQLAESQRVFADYLWVLRQLPQYEAFVQPETPKGLGALNMDNGAIWLVVPAERLAGSGTRRADLASALLIRSLKR
jgi:hypothetical protein